MNDDIINRAKKLKSEKREYLKMFLISVITFIVSIIVFIFAILE
jgi:hypothetical protein